MLGEGIGLSRSFIEARPSHETARAQIVGGFLEALAMIVRPMIGSWEIPRIERIRSHEARRLGTFAVPGLSGDLHQDLGRGALRVEILGSLTGDEARDGLLEELRRKLYAAEPVDFVADVVHDARLEQVLIEAFEVEEVAGSPDAFRYRLVLCEHTEPPQPAGGFAPEALAGVEASLAAEIAAGLDLLDVPTLLAEMPLPKVGDLLVPVEQAGTELTQLLGGAASVLDPLAKLLGGNP
jgi:hypothetical protein